MKQTTAYLGAVLAISSLRALAAPAGNGGCWGDGIPNAPIRPDITCASLSEASLYRLGGDTREEVIKAMGVRGAQHGDELHFLSNNLALGGYSGDLTVTFGPTGTVTIVWAHVARNGADGSSEGDIHFIWNAGGGRLLRLPPFREPVLRSLSRPTSHPSGFSQPCVPAALSDCRRPQGWHAQVRSCLMATGVSEYEARRLPPVAVAYWLEPRDAARLT